MIIVVQHECVLCIIIIISLSLGKHKLGICGLCLNITLYRCKNTNCKRIYKKKKEKKKKKKKKKQKN